MHDIVQTNCISLDVQISDTGLEKATLAEQFVIPCRVWLASHQSQNLATAVFGDSQEGGLVFRRSDLYLYVL